MPDDAAVVIVAGPKTDFFPPEIDALKKYLDKAGKLLLEIDPPEKPDAPPLTNLIALAHDWGIDVGNNVVVDASGMGRLIGTDASVPVAANYPPHPITRALQRSSRRFRWRAIGHAGDRRRQRPHRAAVRRDRARRSWAETDIKGLLTSRQGGARRGQRRQEGPDHDRRGGVARRCDRRRRRQAGATDAPKPETRVVVDRRLGLRRQRRPRHPGQPRPVHEHVGWLSQQENLISIRPKEADDRRITLTATQQANIIWLSLLVIPGVDLRHGRLHLVAEAVDARPAIARLRSSSSSPASARTSTSSTWKKPDGGDSGKKKDKVFAGVEADKIDEIKVTSAARRRRPRSRRTNGAGRSSQPVPAKADEAEVVGDHRRRSRRSRSPASSTRTRPT